MNIEINLKELHLTETLNEFEKNLINVSGKKMHQFIKRNSPKDKGRLADSWELETYDDKSIIKTSLSYADFVNDGTGVFSSRGTPITPKNPNGVMVFTKGGETIFTKRVQGQKGQKYVEKSIEDLENALPQLLLGEIK